MFRCGICDKSVPPRIKPQEIVIKKRKRTYPYRQGANRAATWKQEKHERMASMDDNGGEGWEAAKTAKACPSCANKHKEEAAKAA